MAKANTIDGLVKAGLEPKSILLPSSAAFEERQSCYFSCSARALRPAGIIQPQSAHEVSEAVRALVTAQIPFAVRSGGHTSWVGSNTIGSEGVSIDLGLMDWVKVIHDDKEGQVISIGPGNRWGKVYTELAEQGLTVAGGRVGDVGVAGLILGGGLAFFTARYGLACDNIVDFEVVLADGRIVRARRDGEHADLFLALKGGSNNFGIVTDFKMRALPAPSVWGGMTVHPKKVVPDAILALKAFTDDVPNDVDSNLVCFFTYMPEFKEIVVIGALVQIAGVEKAPAYKKWLEMPTISSTCKMTTIPQFATDYEQAKNYHNTWFTSTFKNDTRIVAKATELHELLVEKLKALIPGGDFITQCIFQPFPKLFGQHSVMSGGNVLGIENQPYNGLLWLAVAQVRTPEQEKFAYSLIRDWVRDVREFANTLTVNGGEGNLPWTYLNYADKSQDPLTSYGMENIVKMKQVAAKYDPDQVFQTLCPGGFKISAVQVPD